MNSGDVFVLDTGSKVWQWNGKTSNVFEKIAAGEFVSDLKKTRAGHCVSVVLEEGDDANDRSDL
jgi:gelsolin